MKLKRFIQSAKNWIVKHKKPLIVAGVILLIVLVVLYFMGVFSKDTVDRTSANTSEQAPAEPVTKASPLTGVKVDPALAERPVTAIMIENSPDARPQSGLAEAGVVFEAIAEGGITRFIALYQEDRPSLIGPVRSVRPYYLDWVMTYDASIAHVGGSAEGMEEIQQFGLKDLDQFYNADTYWRTSDRYAPHNVYTDFDHLDATNQAKGYNTSSFEGLPRKEAQPAATPDAKQITIPISSQLYQVDYTYEPATNSYIRFLGGVPHEDREKGVIKADVVIGMEVSNGIQSANGFRYEYNLVGSGKAYVFQDGTAVEGTWSRADRNSQFVFKDSTGKVVELNPGRTWITATSPGNGIAWTP